MDAFYQQVADSCWKHHVFNIRIRTPGKMALILNWLPGFTAPILWQRVKTTTSSLLHEIRRCCYHLCYFLSILAAAVAAEEYQAWNLAMDKDPISDFSPYTCANLQPPSGNGLLIMNTSDFTELRVRLFTTNLAVTPIDCHSNPLLLFTNGGAGMLASDGCKPLCGHPAACVLEGVFKEFTVWHCVCPGGSCNQIAFGISPGAFIDRAMPATICNVDVIYVWNVSWEVIVVVLGATIVLPS